MCALIENLPSFQPSISGVQDWNVSNIIFEILPGKPHLRGSSNAVRKESGFSRRHPDALRNLGKLPRTRPSNRVSRRV